MNKYFTTAFMLFAAACTAHSQITLNAGETFTYSFNSLPLTRVDPGGYVGGPAIRFNYTATGHDPGEDMRYELFENATNDVPFFTDLYSSGFSGGISFRQWADLQGVVRFTMLTGSMTLQDFDIHLSADQNSTATAIYDLHVVPSNTQPARLNLRLQPSGSSLTFTGTVSALYKIQQAPMLPATNWATLTNLYLPSSPFTFVDRAATNSGRRFYRVLGYNEFKRP